MEYKLASPDAVAEVIESTQLDLSSFQKMVEKLIVKWNTVVFQTQSNPSALVRCNYRGVRNFMAPPVTGPRDEGGEAVPADRCIPRASPSTSVAKRYRISSEGKSQSSSAVAVATSRARNQTHGDSAEFDFLESSSTDEKSAARHKRRSDGESERGTPGSQNRKKRRPNPQNWPVRPEEGIFNAEGKVAKRCKWTEEEKDTLKRGVRLLGKGKWAEIKNRYPLIFRNRSSIMMKDCWRTMKNKQEVTSEDENYADDMNSNRRGHNGGDEDNSDNSDNNNNSNEPIRNDAASNEDVTDV